MATKQALKGWILEALSKRGPSTVTEVAREIWHTHEAELRASGDLFFTWQYDMRWQAQKLQEELKLVKQKSDLKWVLA